jgi:Molybdopterin cofactor-binding domain
MGRVAQRQDRAQSLVGGMIQGLGMALLEGTWVDPRFGRFVNASMADYLVPVNADIRHIDAIWVDEADPHLNAIGARAREIPIIGTPAAVANAVYNATGPRVRELPITAEKLSGLAILGVVAERHHPPTQRPLRLEAAILSRMRSEVTSRSNWANDSRTFSVSRDERYVVLVEQPDQLGEVHQ